MYFLPKQSKKYREKRRGFLYCIFLKSVLLCNQWKDMFLDFTITISLILDVCFLCAPDEKVYGRKLVFLRLFLCHSNKMI